MTEPRRTKILATLGPASLRDDVLPALIAAGVDGFRLNFSHGDAEAHHVAFQRVREASRKAGVPVAVVQDIQGPKIRVGTLPEPLALEADAQVTFVVGDTAPRGTIPVTYDNLAADVKVGDAILMDDGYLGAVVTDVVDRGTVRARIVTGGTLKSNKGVNLPGVRLSAKFPTAKDLVDLRLGQELGVDFVAASFIRSAADVARVRAELDDDVGTRVIAKVESREAVENIDEVVRAADAVMVARGDLGVELDAWDVPGWQKRIIDLCDTLGTPVITATQMLESMIEHPRPTRAEATDVFNAVMDGTSAVMLSGETAVGKHPLTVVKTMARICVAAEEQRRASPRDERERALARRNTVSDAVAHAACQAAEDLDAAAIVALTHSGATARFVSKHKPRTRIIGATPNARTLRQLRLVWGVEPLASPAAESLDGLLRFLDHALTASGLLQEGDTVVVTHGRPGVAGTTDQIHVMDVGRFHGDGAR